MLIINSLFLPALLFVGVITSHEDFYFGKIKNKWILMGISWGLLSLLILFILKYLGVSDAASHQYIDKVLINFVLAIAVSFSIWTIGGWSAGDAKLFMVFSLLVPLNFYWKSYLPYFPSFVLLINTFFLVFAYFFISAVVFNLNYIRTMIFKKTGGFSRGDLHLANAAIKNIINVGRIGVSHEVSLSGMIFSTTRKMVNGFFKSYMKSTGTKRIRMGELKPGMILGRHWLGDIFKKEIEESGSSFGGVGREGLSLQQVALIKKWAAEKNITKIKVLKTFPFALWMFAGVILTLLIKVSIINLLINIF